MPPLPPPRGILSASRRDGLLDARRFVPSLELAPYIHHHWSIRWSLRAPFKGEALPHPAVQILRIATSAERSALVLGVRSGTLARTLTDEGETFGVSFRPVMFRALLGASMASITDRVVPLSPKSVIQRYRLHEAAIQLRAPHPPLLAELAASLG